MAALQARSAGSPPTGGASAPAVLERLSGIAGLQEAAQANAAVVLVGDVRRAVDGERLDAALGSQVTGALVRVATPPDLVGLVRLVQHDAPALGRAGKDLGGRLIALDHRTASKDVPRRADQLLDVVRYEVAAGRLVPAIGRIVVPVLEPLARTQPLIDLQQLVTTLRADP